MYQYQFCRLFVGCDHLRIEWLVSLTMLNGLISSVSILLELVITLHPIWWCFMK